MKETGDRKVILITGASSGIGYETARRLAGEGHSVYGAARRVERMEPLTAEGVVPLKMDVTDEASVTDGVSTILSAEGRIDVLINNAGYGYFGAIEDVPLEEARRQLEVNLFAMARLTRLVLPVMRRQHAGRIINLSSVAGKAVFLFGGWYHVSKFAVEAFSDALRMEVQPFGIDVTLIEPGGIRTAWGDIAADHLAESAAGGPYEAEAMHAAKILRKGYSIRLLSPPGTVAGAIARAVRARHPRARYRMGFASHITVAVHALLPARWWDALMRAAWKIRV